MNTSTIIINPGTPTSEIIYTLNKQNINGYKIIFSAGEHLIDEEILLENISGLIINAENGTILKNKPGYTGRIFSFRYCTDISFYGLIFDGGLTTFNNPIPKSQAICYNIECTGLKVENCKFFNFADCAIVDRTQSLFYSEINLTDSPKNSKTIIRGNMFFNCFCTYITKAGGGKNIIYTSNIHEECIVCPKIDGEALDVGSIPFTFDEKTGNCLITNNIFYKNKSMLDGYGSCIELEENIQNIIISNNIFDSSATDCIKFDLGQSIKDVDNIIVSNNQFINTERYSIVMRTNGDGKRFKNISFNNNKFIKNKKNAFYIISNHEKTYENISISNNSFDLDISNDYPLINIVGLVNIVSCKSFKILNNDFYFKDINTINNRMITIKDFKGNNEDDIYIKGNYFYNSGLSINTKIEFISTKVKLCKNKFKNLNINSKDSFINIENNEYISSFQTFNIPINTIKFRNNVFDKADGAGNYGVKVNDGGNIIGNNNKFIGGYTDPVWILNGAYKEDNELILYDEINRQHYKLTLINGELKFTQIIL